MTLTLLFMNLFGVRRTWDLRSYSGDGLALVSGRKHAYGYIHAERFLSQWAASGGAGRLTNELAGWTSDLWQVGQTPIEEALYIDGHRKAVYSDSLLPRGLVARHGKILGCRALTLLHDSAGHPLLALTDRGDQHLTVGLPQIVSRYEQTLGQGQLARIVVDREGMGAAFLYEMSQSRTVITLLRTDQYQSLDSFTEVGEFVPLDYDRHGRLIREVASARITLMVPGESGNTLPLSVALVRDLRREVPAPPDEDSYPRHWDEDLRHEDRRWWEGDWTATPAPAARTTPKLIPVVCTAVTTDAHHLARTYFHRWVAQENSIRDFLIPLGLDINHGYAKTPVENSEVSKRRVVLLKRLDNCQRWGEKALRKARWNSQRYRRLYDQTKAYGDAQYRMLNLHASALAHTALVEDLQRRVIKDEQRLIDADLQQRWTQVQHCSKRSHSEWQKYERYCQEQRQLLRDLETLNTQARSMYELDHAKDQVMTLCKLALANLVMWTRDHCFPATYARASTKRLLPFFRLPGRLLEFHDRLQVSFRPFNDRALNRDLAALCQRINQAQLHLPSGKRLIFRIVESSRPTSVASP
jgi:hypothetical protein